MWQRLFAVLAASASLCVSAPSSGIAAEQRLALVIGNSAYEKNTPLANPQNDAQAVAQLLNSAGFEVVMAFDLTRDIMKQTIEEFAARITEKGGDSAALVYYAGHGMQVDGENFLVPVDAKLEKESDLADAGIKLADVMGALQSAPSKIRIVILDACRNNPFQASGAGGKGLAIVDAPSGTIVAYSTAPGTEALDGTGKHSPFAAAFMRTVKQPDLPVEQVFKRVRRLVNDSTDNRQTPWESSSLTADFVFFSSAAGQPGGADAPAGANAPGNVSQAAAPGRISSPPAAARVEKVSVADLRQRPAIQAYDLVIEEDSVEFYEEFLRLFPQDPLAVHVRRKLALRNEMLDWQRATYRNTPEAYARFASRHNDGAMFVAARKLQERPRPIEIALPRRGDPRLNLGNFGTFRINVSRGAPVIGFPRGSRGEANRNPAIPFPRNEGRDGRRFDDNRNRASLPGNANPQSKSRFEQNRDRLQDRRPDAKQGREREDLRNSRFNRGGDSRRTREGNNRDVPNRRGDANAGSLRSRIENRGVVRRQNAATEQNFRRNENFRRSENFQRSQNFQRGQNFQRSQNFQSQQNVQRSQNFRPQQSSRDSGFRRR